MQRHRCRSRQACEHQLTCLYHHATLATYSDIQRLMAADYNYVSSYYYLHDMTTPQGTARRYITWDEVMAVGRSLRTR